MSSNREPQTASRVTQVQSKAHGVMIRAFVYEERLGMRRTRLCCPLRRALPPGGLPRSERICQRQLGLLATEVPWVHRLPVALRLRLLGQPPNFTPPPSAPVLQAFSISGPALRSEWAEPLCLNFLPSHPGYARRSGCLDQPMCASCGYRLTRKPAGRCEYLFESQRPMTVMLCALRSMPST